MSKIWNTKYLKMLEANKAPTYCHRCKDTKLPNEFKIAYKGIIYGNPQYQKPSYFDFVCDQCQKELKALFYKIPKGMECKVRNKDKQRETRLNYGWHPLNKHFEGSNGHHINKDDIIYIPAELHRQYPHAQKDKQSMKIINKKAFEYMYDHKDGIIKDRLEKYLSR